MPLIPLALGPNQPRQFYRGGERIARFRGLPGPSSPYHPEDLVASATELFGRPGAGLTVLPGGVTLRDAIAADPAGYLGPERVGVGRLATDAGEFAVARGMTVLVPYGAGPTRLAGDVSVLRCLPPAP
jgi:hypothetical protein